MNLVLHQFKKDVRQFWVWLAVWFGLLLLNLAVNLGWAGQVVYNFDHGFDHAANTWTGLLPEVIWVLAAVLPSLVVLTDSPARREGFLATRPLSKVNLFLAKLLFILALIVAPWTLQELIHLAVGGMPAWVIEAGTLERLMFILPVAVGFGAYAALWPSHARWARAAGISLAGGYLLLGLTALIAIFILHYQTFLDHISLAQEIVGMDELTLAMILFMVWHSRAHRGAFVRWSGLALVGLTYFLTMTCWSWDFFAMRPENPAAAAAARPTTVMQTTPRALYLQTIRTTDNYETPHFTVNLASSFPVLPAKDLVDWQATNAKLVRADGGGIRGENIGNRSVFTGTPGSYAYNTPDFIAWSADFPTNVLFRQNNNYGLYQSEYMGLGHFRLPADPAARTEPLTLQAGYEARVFQWRKIADLPVTPGATATDAFGSWKFIAAKADIPGMTQFYLERRQIELATGTDSRCSTAAGGALGRMAFMVYDPLRNIVWMPEQNSFISVTRGTETALADYFSTFYISGRKGMTREELARCRLVIFEKSWLGSVPQSLQSTAFTLDEKLQPAGLVTSGNQNPMPRTEFNRRVAALKAPAPDASRQEISLYLLDYLRLVDAQQHTLGLHDPQTRRLATYVPAHLDLLLDGLPVMEQASRQSVINAIKLGATDAQKPVIITALRHDPQLAEVLLARGWLEDARPEILQLAQSPRSLPIAAWQAIAWFHDPQTYPRLLEEFTFNPTPDGDDVLHTLPELDAQTDAIIARHWHEQSIVIRNSQGQFFDDQFLLALRHGQASALQRVYACLDAPEFEELNTDWQLDDALWQSVQIPDVKPNDRQQSGFAVAWMRKHRQEDFIFNPALRQFVLKSAPPAGQTFTASNP